MNESFVVSIVIGSYNRLDFLKSTIATVREDIRDLKHEIIIVDGGSDDGSIEWLVQQKDIITILQHNRGVWKNAAIEKRSWGYFMNLGFRAASGKYICMLSDDCLVVPNAITNGINLFNKELAKNNQIGQIAFYWRNWPEQNKYWVGLAWGNRMFVNHGLYLREALEKVNFIDDKNYSFYHADGDLSLRLWDAGYKCIDSPQSFIEHYSDANTEVRVSNLEKQKIDWDTYTKKWSKLGAPKNDWIELEYKDKSRTAQKRWKFKRGLRKRLFS